jgi:hypothetical protein
MSLLSIVIALVVVGVVLYAINTFIPMDAKVKRLLNVVVICMLVIWLLREAGLISYLSKVRI